MNLTAKKSIISLLGILFLVSLVFVQSTTFQPEGGVRYRVWQ